MVWGIEFGTSEPKAQESVCIIITLSSPNQIKFTICKSYYSVALSMTIGSVANSSSQLQDVVTLGRSSVLN